MFVMYIILILFLIFFIPSIYAFIKCDNNCSKIFINNLLMVSGVFLYLGFFYYTLIKSVKNGKLPLKIIMDIEL